MGGKDDWTVQRHRCSHSSRADCKTGAAHHEEEKMESSTSLWVLVSLLFSWLWLSGLCVLECIFFVLYIAVLDLNLSLVLDIWTIYLIYVFAHMFDQFLWIYILGYIFYLMHLNDILISSILDLCLCLFYLDFMHLKYIIYYLQGSYFSVYCCSCSDVLF